MNRVGAVEITDVKSVATTAAPGGRTMLTFTRRGSEPPPVIDVPQTARIVAMGEDLGVWEICCHGRHPRPGGFVSIKGTPTDASD